MDVVAQGTLYDPEYHANPGKLLVEVTNGVYFESLISKQNRLLTAGYEIQFASTAEYLDFNRRVLNGEKPVITIGFEDAV